jgi:hypothetical protein
MMISRPAPKNEKPATRAVVARHEAGHAIMAILTGCIIAHAELLDEGHGVTVIGQLGTECPLVMGLVAWGGSVAEGVDWLNEDDAAPLQRLGFSDPSILTLRLWCRGMLQQFKPAVRAVGKALDARGKLSGTTIRRIAFAASPGLRAASPTIPRGAVRQFREAHL